MVVYDVSSQQSFERVMRWIAEIRGNSNCINVILVGNKSDLEARAVSTEAGQALADEVH